MQQAVLLGELLEVGHARHRAVVAHDLADDAGGLEPGEAREIDRALGLPGAHQHAAALARSGKTWPGVTSPRAARRRRPRSGSCARDRRR